MEHQSKTNSMAWAMGNFMKRQYERGYLFHRLLAFNGNRRHFPLIFLGSNRMLSFLLSDKGKLQIFHKTRMSQLGIVCLGENKKVLKFQWTHCPFKMGRHSFSHLNPPCRVKGWNGFILLFLAFVTYWWDTDETNNFVTNEIFHTRSQKHTHTSRTKNG